MYISTMQSKDGKILVAERRDGERVFSSYDPDYHFYISDPRGSFTSMYGNPVRRIEASTKEERKKNKMAFGRVTSWESDIDVKMRCLEQNYRDTKLPNLQVAFFDIETDFDKEFGYSEAVDALNPITSISIYLQWIKQCVCIAVPPKTLTFDDAKKLTAHLPEVILVKTEGEMLQLFLQLIDDCDVLSGWNSTSYDIVYTTNRIIKVLGKVEARNLCFWGQMPRKRTFNNGMNDVTTYELEGRVHLDYLDLYKKFTYEEHQSYSLNSIATAELSETKVEYDGTLDRLYNFDFVKFLEYNIQDTMLLDRLDQKLQLIKLVNTVAHINCVPLETVLGTVSLVDQSIMLEAHSRNLVVKDKPTASPDALRAAGGWVAHPKPGLHKYIASTDMKSLYPSVIRTWNMSPETIVGQLRLSETERQLRHHLHVKGEDKFAEWWNDRFEPLEMKNFHENDIANKMTLDMESGDQFEITGAELRRLIFDSGEPFCISANGTVFRTDILGLIPGILARWYDERKGYQKKAKDMERVLNGLAIDKSLSDSLATLKTSELTADVLREFSLSTLNELIASVQVNELSSYLSKYGLKVEQEKILPADNYLVLWEDIHSNFDLGSQSTKILMNSLYGALLNESFRYYDQRMGQSVTLSGRNVTRHMCAKTNAMLCGVYDHTGECIIGGDTDSVVGSTNIHSSFGSMSIENLFDKCEEFFIDGEKEYAYDEDLMVISYDSIKQVPYMGHIEYIYRHKVNKKLYDIEDELGNILTVTEDHSVIVLRGGKLMEAKPLDILDTDELISLEIDYAN